MNVDRFTRFFFKCFLAALAGFCITLLGETLGAYWLRIAGLALAVVAIPAGVVAFVIAFFLPAEGPGMPNGLREDLKKGKGLLRAMKWLAGDKDL